MADFRAFVANCLIGGEESTQEGIAGARDVVRFNWGGFRFEFHQKHAAIAGSPEEFKDTFVHTTDVIVREVKQNQMLKLQKVLHKICWLLSFAGLSRVMYFGHKYPDGTFREEKWALST
jgi:hypothetical protein